jgi:hypothetical protein
MLLAEDLLLLVTDDASDRGRLGLAGRRWTALSGTARVMPI